MPNGASYRSPAAAVAGGGMRQHADAIPSALRSATRLGRTMQAKHAVGKSVASEAVQSDTSTSLQSKKRNVRLCLMLTTRPSMQNNDATTDFITACTSHQVKRWGRSYGLVTPGGAGKSVAQCRLHIIPVITVLPFVADLHFASLHLCRSQTSCDRG